MVFFGSWKTIFTQCQPCITKTMGDTHDMLHESGRHRHGQIRRVRATIRVTYEYTATKTTTTTSSKTACCHQSEHNERQLRHTDLRTLTRKQNQTMSLLNWAENWLWRAANDSGTGVIGAHGKHPSFSCRSVCTTLVLAVMAAQPLGAHRCLTTEYKIIKNYNFDTSNGREK